MNEDAITVDPQDEEYRNTERRFLQDIKEECGDDGFSSQYGIVFEHLIPRIRQSAKKDHLTGIDYELRLREAQEITDGIAFALSAGWEKKKPGWIWYKPTLDCVKFRPDSWSDASPVNKSQLDTATARYLQRAWMQLNLLDWYILNGYIFDEVARLADGIKSGNALGIINWAHLFSGGDFEKTIYWRAALEVSKFAARWILGPIIIIAMYYLGYQEIAKWMAVPFGIYLLIHLAFFPRRFLRRKALRFEIKKLEDKLHALINVYQSSSVNIISPSRLRDLIVKTESEEVFFRPAIYSILDRAIERDSAVLALEGGG